MVSSHHILEAHATESRIWSVRLDVIRLHGRLFDLRHTHSTMNHMLIQCNRIQSHYQWVIMAVILIVAIVGGWIAACIFRKRYLRKRELNFELRAPHQPWVGTVDNTSPYG